MRSLSRRRFVDAVSVLFAGVLLNVAVFEALKASPEKLALLAAVAIAAEALQRVDDELLPDALEGERFSLTSSIQIAAILIGGPWIAAAVAGWSVVAVAPFRHVPFGQFVRRASALALAALAGGFALGLAGGVAGQMVLPDDMLPVALAGLVYVTARTLLEGLANRRLALPDVISAAAAIGLGIVLAYAAIHEIWVAIALAPLLLLVERAYARIVGLRREMATALETFANIVDERDPSTYGHSVRVAAHVNELAAALGLRGPRSADCGGPAGCTISARSRSDAAVIAKPGKLSPAEWGTVWRAPRLSARLLQRFRFASQQAQAVEYHRERYNGSGYYRVSSENIPLAAHFLILADRLRRDDDRETVPPPHDARGGACGDRTRKRRAVPSGHRPGVRGRSARPGAGRTSSRQRSSPRSGTRPPRIRLPCRPSERSSAGPRSRRSRAARSSSSRSVRPSTRSRSRARSSRSSGSRPGTRPGAGSRG
jgi:hypothetical protein